MDYINIYDEKNALKLHLNLNSSKIYLQGPDNILLSG